MVTFVATGGNIPLAMSAYGFVSGTIDTYNAGYSVGQSLGIGILSGTASYIGANIGASFGSWVGGSSASAAGLGSAIFSGAFAGAAGGATSAALTGGDVGTATWQGAAIGGTTALFSYGLTYRGPPQVQEQVKQAAKDGDFQQANDIGAEYGPEGRLAAAEEISDSGSFRLCRAGDNALAEQGLKTDWIEPPFAPKLKTKYVTVTPVFRTSTILNIDGGHTIFLQKGIKVTVNFPVYGEKTKILAPPIWTKVVETKFPWYNPNRNEVVV